MIGIIYAVVIFIATFLGACAGLGGGVIIKPVLDFINMHDLATISFLSTSAVFTMALYSTMKQVINKVQFDVAMIVLIAIGAMLGGNIGSSMFNYLLTIWNPSLLKGIQALVLAMLLIVVIMNMNGNFKTYTIKNRLVILLVGFCLGVISSFLGIGGGPINVAVFALFFSVDIKRATVYSIATILFSQGSKLFTIATTTGFAIYDLSLLLYTLPAAILGGIVGTALNKKADNKLIGRIFTSSVTLIILLNLYNAFVAFSSL